jgi:gas vesicle protein
MRREQLASLQQLYHGVRRELTERIRRDMNPAYVQFAEPSRETLELEQAVQAQLDRIRLIVVELDEETKARNERVKQQQYQQQQRQQQQREQQRRQQEEEERRQQRQYERIVPDDVPLTREAPLEPLVELREAFIAAQIGPRPTPMPRQQRTRPTPKPRTQQQEEVYTGKKKFFLDIVI